MKLQLPLPSGPGAFPGFTTLVIPQGLPGQPKAGKTAMGGKAGEWMGAEAQHRGSCHRWRQAAGLHS